MKTLILLAALLNQLDKDCGVFVQESIRVGGIGIINNLVCTPCSCGGSEADCWQYQADEARERENRIKKCNKLKEDAKALLDKYNKGEK